jgi:hypothetical protein
MAQPPLRPFDLQLNRAVNDNIVVRLLDSPAGALDAPETVPHPGSDPQVRDLLDAARKPQVATPELRTLGQLLFKVLAAGAIAERLRVTLREFADPDRPVRMRLLLGDSLLATLPWEVCYDEVEDSFLATDPRVRVRRLLQGGAGTGWSYTKEELGVLMGVSQTTTSDRDSMPLVQKLAAELDSLSSVRTQFMRAPASISALLESTRSETVNALHLFVQATYGQDARPRLNLPDGAIDPDTLATVLRASSVPVAVLCATGRADQAQSSDETRALLDFAAQLVLLGIPSVLAVPASMTDRSGVMFWKAFYGTLAEGQALDEALKVARNALLQRREPAPYWYLPALFTGADDSALFPFGGLSYGTPASKGWESLP